MDSAPWDAKLEPRPAAFNSIEWIQASKMAERGGIPMNRLFQFHWMDSRGGGSCGATLASDFSFNSIEWIRECFKSTGGWGCWGFLSIPLNGFVWLDLLLAPCRARLCFQFHWMDSGLWFYVYAYKHNLLKLSIPLNGFLDVLFQYVCYDFFLSIPLNGFITSTYCLVCYQVALSIPLNGFPGRQEAASALKLFAFNSIEWIRNRGSRQ